MPIDEAAGRTEATKVGLAVIGTLGILLRAKQQSHVAAIRPLLDHLQDELGFFIFGELKAEIFRRAGES